MIFPTLGPETYGEKHSDILLRMETSYNQALTINLVLWGEGDIDQRFYAGDSSIWNEYYGNLPFAKQNQFNFNLIRSNVDLVGGYQRRNRKKTVVTPAENASQQAADDFTDVLMWQDRQQNISDSISRAFHMALVSGMSFLQLWQDYRVDPINGNLNVTPKAFNTVMYDPFFREPDMSDCSFLWQRSYVTKREAISLLPSKTDEIMGMYGNNNKDGKFQFIPESYNYGQTNLLTYDEYYHKDYRSQLKLIDEQTGEQMEWRLKNNKALNYWLYKFPQLQAIKQEIPTVKLAIVVNGHVLKEGPQPLGIDRYPYIPVFCYFNPDTPYYNYRVQGIVRGLRDAQYLFNRRKIIELDILESQVNSGWKLKENALINFEDVFLSGQGKPLVLKKDALMTDVEKILPGEVSPSMMQLSNALSDLIPKISGINEELLGSAVDDKAGILSMLRQGAGLTTLQKLFDQLDYSQKLLGSLMVEAIQLNYTPEKIKRIIQREPDQRFYDKNFGEYDCVIEEGFDTTTQKQMQFAQMIQLRELGVPIPASALLDTATLQNKNQLVQQINQMEQQQQQIQQAQMQQQMQRTQSEINLANATASANENLGLERISRINENQQLAVERQAQAEREQAAKILDLTKALAQIEQINISSLEKLVALVNMTAVQQPENSNSLEVGQPKLTPIPEPEEPPKIKGVPQEQIV